MDNMTIGASLAVGGNTVQMRKDGKIQVTNSNGKIKTLTQDEFKKNVVKNADKIKNGEDFEFKKDYSKSLKIATAAVGTAIATTGIIYRKEIGKYLRNFSFKKLWQDIKGLFSKNKKNTSTIYDKFSLPKKYKDNKAFVEEAVNTKNLKDSIIADATKKWSDRVDTATSKLAHDNKQAYYNEMFSKIEGDIVPEKRSEAIRNVKQSEFADARRRAIYSFDTKTKRKLDAEQRQLDSEIKAIIEEAKSKK